MGHRWKVWAVVSEQSVSSIPDFEWRLTLTEIWDDYATVIDDHASEEIRREARANMLRRFAWYQDQGWLEPREISE